MTRFPSLLAVAALAALLGFPSAGPAQEIPEWLRDLKLPNSVAKSLMTPSAWGAAYGTAFVGAGAAKRTPYLPSADGVMALGYGLSDPVLNVGVQLGSTVSDISEFDNVSFSFKVHRYVGRGTAVAVGGESLFSGGPFVDDAGDTFYLVVSHVLQGVPSSRPGIGRVHMSAGVGTGRFAKKSDRDFSEGKGRNGTRAFASVAVEMSAGTNVILEWSGTNLLTGLSRTIRTTYVPVALSFGLADLTNFSGDGVRLVAGVAFAVSF